MSRSIKECCVSGHLHCGNRKRGPENRSKDKTIPVITDIFGYQLPVQFCQAISLTKEFTSSIGCGRRDGILCLCMSISQLRGFLPTDIPNSYLTPRFGHILRPCGCRQNRPGKHPLQTHRNKAKISLKTRRRQSRQHRARRCHHGPLSP